MGNSSSHGRARLLPEVRADIEEKLLCLENDESLSRVDPARVDELAGRSFLELRALIGDRLATLPEAVLALHVRKQRQNNRHCSLTDVFLSGPLRRAEEMQARFESDPDGTLRDLPLLGCILSLKDSVLFRGSSSTQGFAKGYGKPYERSAPLVDFLEALGAVVVCKGNVPQALMSCESTNGVFGAVSHPAPGHLDRTAGGSSGGEAVNVATGLANCAVGSDIAGSLRIPALFCGLFSLKPTAGRFADCEGLSFAERWDSPWLAGDLQTIIAPTCGPIARSANDVEALAIAMNAFNELSLAAPPLPWRPANTPHRIGRIPGFDLLEVTKVQSRALDEAIGMLSGDVVDVDLNDIVEDLTVTAVASYLRDEQSLRLIRGDLDIGEPLAEVYDEFKRLVTFPLPLLRIAAQTSAFSYREKVYIRAYLRSMDYNLAMLIADRNRLREEVLRRFRAAGVEVCLTYGLPPAMRRSTSKDCDLQCLYCFIWNLVNFPVGAVPITTVREEEEQYSSKWKDGVTKAITANMQGSRGLPVGVQVVGLPWHEELVVEVMKHLQSSLT